MKEVYNEFSKEWRKHYALEFFKEEGFERVEKGGKGFWVADPNLEWEEGKYTFIGKKLNDLDYWGVWKKYEQFFKEAEIPHTPIQSYPVVCRWKDDLHFTIASIVDFMRKCDGELCFEFPEENLIVPQFCLRFNDIPNVGITGRHFTGFIMPGQHSIQYWKEDAVRLGYEFLLELGVKPESIVFEESVWSMPDKSAYGPCFEVMVDGLEIVTQVFMEFSSGKRMKRPVIDVGWGLERLAWLVSGKKTAYDATFSFLPKMLKDVKIDKELLNEYCKIAGVVNLESVDVRAARKTLASLLGIGVEELKEFLEPLHAVYAIADHVRSLSVAIRDGAIPSNAGGGHNLRIIFRRAYNFWKEHPFAFDLFDVVDWVCKDMKIDEEKKAKIYDIFEREKKKYESTLKLHKNKLNRIIESQPTLDDFLIYYESYGITPEMIEEWAEKRGVRIKIPPNFYQVITKEKTESKSKHKDVGLVTIPLYYDKVFEFEAKVLRVLPDEKGVWIILDRTAFYPLAGGQDFDKGTLNGKDVIRVEKWGNAIAHLVNAKIGEFKEGDTVFGKVDKERRKILTIYHTATHVLNGAARAVLGDHVWQAGAEKKVNKARLDISHYELPDEETIRKIEDAANKIVFEGRPVIKREMDRGEAERKYGFRIYQGGAIPKKRLRIIEIKGWDIEACGGTHVDNTREIGLIKILRVEKIQDGVIRMEFVAGEKVLDVLREKEKILSDLSKILHVPQSDLVNAVKKMKKEMEELRELVDQLRRRVDVKGKELSGAYGKGVVYKVEIPDMKMFEELGEKAKAEGKDFCVVVGKGMIYGWAKDVSSGIFEVVEEGARIFGGKAGKKGNEIKGGGPQKEKWNEVWGYVLSKLGSEVQ